jgi:hypothetical protein
MNQEKCSRAKIGEDYSRGNMSDDNVIVERMQENERGCEQDLMARKACPKPRKMFPAFLKQRLTKSPSFCQFESSIADGWPHRK